MQTMFFTLKGGVQGENNRRLFHYSMPRSGILEPWFPLGRDLKGTVGSLRRGN